MDIDARNLAAALAYQGADVESALLELVAVSQSLEAKVRRALYHHCELPKLRLIVDRQSSGLKFVDYTMTRATCAMHAADAVCTVLDDADCVRYLRAKFPEYKLESLIARGL